MTQLHQLTARVPFDERRRSDVPLSSVSPRLLARYLHDVGSDLAADPDTQPVRASWAWFDIAKVRAFLQDPEASIEDALSRALQLNPGEPQFHDWGQQRAKPK